MGKTGAVVAITIIVLIAIALLALYQQGKLPGIANNPLAGQGSGTSTGGTSGTGSGGAIRVKEYKFHVDPREVTRDKTPVHVVLKLENTLPDIQVGGKMSIEVDGLPIASINIPKQLIRHGESSLELLVTIENTLLDELWYRHLSQGEKSQLRVKGYLEATRAGIKIPIDYSDEIETSIFPYKKDLDETIDLGVLGKIVVQELRAKLGKITPEKTWIDASLRVKNELKTPLVVKGITFAIRLADGTTIAEGSQASPVTIARGEEDDIPFHVVIDNTKLPTIWYQHLKNNEKTVLVVNIWLEAEVAGKKVELLKKHPIEAEIVIETDLFD